jgi:hypothetical protein
MAGGAGFVGDIGISTSMSSAAQSGQATSGSFEVSGSNKTPAWVWIAIGIAGVILLWPRLKKLL